MLRRLGHWRVQRSEGAPQIRRPRQMPEQPLHFLKRIFLHSRGASPAQDPVFPPHRGDHVPIAANEALRAVCGERGQRVKPVSQASESFVNLSTHAFAAPKSWQRHYVADALIQQQCCRQLVERQLCNAPPKCNQ